MKQHDVSLAKYSLEKAEKAKLFIDEIKPYILSRFNEEVL